MAQKRKRQLKQYGKQRREHHITWSEDGNFSMSWFPSTNDIDQSQKPLPKKPASQREATMPGEPEEDKIQMVMDFTSMPRNQAIRYLKAKHNNLEQAVEAALNGEDISQLEQASTWDEGMFNADRNTGQTEEGMQHLRPLAASAAATRPNSPAPSMSGRSGLHPTTKAEEDEDLARAMAMSQGDIGVTYQQESGRIGADGQQTTFGPATKEYYESSKWAMVPAGMYATSEVVPDVDVEQRKHTPGEPRVLKHMPNGDYTPNFFTICAVIPGAREGLLMRDQMQMNYGQDAEWWRGHPIRKPKIVHIGDGSPSELEETEKWDELIEEVQRIMAFLCASDRSYASIGALTQTEVIKNSNISSTSSRTLLEIFLREWYNSAMSKMGLENRGGLSSLFTTTIGTTNPDGMDTPDMRLIDMPVTILEGSKSDLFEQLDSLLWDADVDDNTDNYIERPADVLVMRVYQQNTAEASQLRVEVPAEFYVDKYLPENIEATRATRRKMADGKKRIEKIEEIEKKLMTWKHPTKNEQLDAGVLLKHTLGHFSGENRVEAIKSDKTSNMPEEMTATPPHYKEITAKLEKVVKSIENKLNILAEEKEKTRKAISEMSRAPPPGLEPEDLKHRYTLRGVATKPNITYILCQDDSDTIDEMIDDDNTPAGMRWWRLEYEVTATGLGTKITKTKTADYDVIRAVELEHSSALLVYASDRANAPIPDTETLPPELQEFINKDNALFATELHAERTKPPAYDLTDVPRESIEGRGSMDSTRVEGADSHQGSPSPPGYGGDDFMGHPDFGLGPDIKQGYRDDEDAPVHEIKLDEPSDMPDLVDLAEDEGVEMVEVPHEPLIPGLKEDAVAGGGGGTAAHVEDVGKRV